MLFHTQSSTDKEVDAVELLEQKYCDGIVMVSFDFCEKNISAVIASNKPVVLTNYYDKILPNSNYDCVYVDHTEALRMLTQHIITVGGRNILYIGGDVKTQTAKERRKGYEKALQENNRDIDTRLMADGKFTQEGGYIQAKKALESGLQIDSIITANDLMCIGVLKYLYEKDIVVGKDIMLASVDNSDFVQNTHPTITAIDLCQDEIGLKASSLLMDRILNKRTTSKVVKILPKLIIRNSTSKAQGNSFM
ncbi:MAG: substrate-binding domain-containing protein [Clostridia bacterium]